MTAVHISTQPGKSGYDACHISADQLWDLDEAREIAFTLEAQSFISREPGSSVFYGRFLAQQLKGRYQ